MEGAPRLAALPVSANTNSINILCFYFDFPNFISSILDVLYEKKSE